VDPWEEDNIQCSKTKSRRASFRSTSSPVARDSIAHSRHPTLLAFRELRELMLQKLEGAPISSSRNVYLPRPKTEMANPEDHWFPIM